MSFRVNFAFEILLKHSTQFARVSTTEQRIGKHAISLQTLALYTYVGEFALTCYIFMETLGA